MCPSLVEIRLVTSKTTTTTTTTIIGHQCVLSWWFQICARGASRRRKDAEHPSDVVATGELRTGHGSVGDRWAARVWIPRSQKRGRQFRRKTGSVLFFVARLVGKGGFRHVQHVWPNRGPHTKGPPHGTPFLTLSLTLINYKNWSLV